MDSILRHFPRPFDFAATKHAVFSNSVALSVYKRCFLLALRLSLVQETDADHMEPAYWAEIAYTRRLFDIPKLLDLVALYAPNNMGLVSDLVWRVCQQQPRYARGPVGIVMVALVVIHAEKRDAHTYAVSHCTNASVCGCAVRVQV